MSPPLAEHFHGHRDRLRTRFREAGSDALADYELIELILFRAIPRIDVKPLAKSLIARFGSFSEVIAARPERLREIDGLGEAAICEIKLVEAAARKLARGALEKRTVLSSFVEVIDYCRTAMAYAEREEFRVLFLDKRNGLIADEVQGVGTVDHTPVYPREVVRRALELGSWSDVIDHCRTAMAFEDHDEFRVLFLDKKNGLIADELQGVGTVDHTPVYPREIVKRALELAATAVLLVHNHPSGDPTPSTQDVKMTLDIIAVAAPLGVTVHDHIIVGRQGHTSLRGQKLI